MIMCSWESCHKWPFNPYISSGHLENHSHKQPAPVTDTFFTPLGCRLVRACTVVPVILWGFGLHYDNLCCYMQNVRRIKRLQDILCLTLKLKGPDPKKLNCKFKISLQTQISLSLFPPKKWQWKIPLHLLASLNWTWHCFLKIAKDMERWAKSVNAAKTQSDDVKKGTTTSSPSEQVKSVDTDIFKVVRYSFLFRQRTCTFT